MYRDLYPVTYYFYPLLPPGNKPQDLLSRQMQQLHKALVTPAGNISGSLLYIHIPYCHDICQFCPFHVRVDDDNTVFQKYTDGLIREMQLLADQPRIADMTFTSVYFGGGSPSIFPAEMIDKLLITIKALFKLTPDVEISFEGEPATLSDNKRLDVLESHSVARLSFGLQTYDQKMRELFKIKATLNDIANVRKNTLNRSFTDINVDMMYALPGQNISSLYYDLEHLRDDGFDSVDYYNLHYFAFPGKFIDAMNKGEIPAKPDQDMHFALLQEVMDYMKSNGYHYVADQVFSKHQQVCEYFRVLWGGGYGQHNAETIAVGASARGYIDGMSYMNRTNVRDYLAMLDKNVLPFQKVSSQLNNPANRGAAFFLKFFSHLKQYQQSLDSISIDLLRRWENDGLIRESADAWQLSEAGKLWIPNMVIELFEQEQRVMAEASTDTLIAKHGTRTGSF